MDNSLKISSTNFEDKTKIELAICQLYNFYFKNNNKAKTNGQRIRTKHYYYNLLFFSKIEMHNKKLCLEKFENMIRSGDVKRIRTFSKPLQISVFQLVIRKIQFKSCTKQFNDNPSKFTEKS